MIRRIEILQLKIPPPIYALMIAISMWLLNQYWPLFQLIESPWNKIGIGIMVAAATLDVWSLVLFFRKHTTLNPMKPKNTSGIVTSGLYRISRNPMYLGLLIILAGFAIWLGSFSPFLALPVFYWLITHMQIKPEERILEAAFGQQYLDFKHRVRRWL